MTHTTHGLVRPSTARNAQRYVKNLSIFEGLESYEAKFLSKPTTIFTTTLASLDFLVCCKSLNLLTPLVAGGGIEPPTLGL